MNRILGRLLLGLFLLAALALGLRRCGPAGGGLGLWRQLTRAEMELRVREFVSGIPVLKEDMRLVVASLDMVKTVAGESSKRAFGLDLGTTKVSLSVPARVHYAIDLSGKLPVEFHIDEQARLFTAVFPEPEVQAVEVFSKDKRTLKEIGWARLESLSGRHLENDLERGLYDAVKAEASSAPALGQVRDRARPVLARFVSTYLRDMGGSEAAQGFRHISVRFRGESPQGPAVLYPPRLEAQKE